MTRKPEPKSKIRVVVTKFPDGYEGAREPVLGADGKPVRDQMNRPATQTVPDVLKLEHPGKLKKGQGKNAPWRARLDVETPIPDDFVPVLKASGALWHYVDGSRVHPDDDVG